MAKIDTKYGRELKNEKHTSIHIPYSNHVNDHTVRLKDGQLIQVLKLDGVSFETISDDSLEALHEQRNQLLRNIADGRLTVWSNIVRRRVDHFPGGNFEDDFTREFNEKYQRKVTDKTLYINEVYLTLVFKDVVQAPPMLKVVIETFKKSLNKAASQLIKDSQKDMVKRQVKFLNEKMETCVEFLGRFQPRKLGVYGKDGGLHSEIYEFLGQLTNGQPGPMPLGRQDASKIIPSVRHFFGKDAGQVGSGKQKKLFGAIGIQEYPAATQYNKLNDLLNLNAEFSLSQSFNYVPKSQAVEKMQLQVGRLRQSGDLAESQIEEIEDSLDDLISNRIVMGNHHFNLLVFAANQQALDTNLSKAISIMGSLGGKAARETLALEAGYWAQLPGNMKYRPRVSMITNRNYSALNTYHNYPPGKITDNHWGEAVTMFPTTSSSPYFFNFHRGDLGHTTIIGPSGTGKTVLMGFLTCQSQKFSPRMCLFDKDRGAEIFIRAQGGNYTAISSGQPTGMNPLQLTIDGTDEKENERNKAFLKSWMAKLISLNNSSVTLKDTNEINRVIESLHTLDQEDRRLTNIIAMFDVTSEGGVADRLANWCFGGTYGWVFDSPTDSLSLSSRVVGFDMTEILDDPVARTPVIFYLFHRMDEMIDGSPFIGLFDEGWKLLDDELFPPMLKDKYKTIRKKNGVLVFGSNDAADATSSAVGKVIIQQSPTKIFMSNEDAKREEYVDGWGLTEKEFALIKSMSKESRRFLIKQGENSVVAILDLKGFSDEINVLSAREDTVRLLDEIRYDVGDEPSDWLPRFQALLNQKGELENA